MPEAAGAVAAGAVACLAAVATFHEAQEEALVRYAIAPDNLPEATRAHSNVILAAAHRAILLTDPRAVAVKVTSPIHSRNVVRVALRNKGNSFKNVSQIARRSRNNSCKTEPPT